MDWQSMNLDYGFQYALQIKNETKFKCRQKTKKLQFQNICITHPLSFYDFQTSYFFFLSLCAQFDTWMLS